jgi:hypothetical protein
VPKGPLTQEQLRIKQNRPTQQPQDGLYGVLADFGSGRRRHLAEVILVIHVKNRIEIHLNYVFESMFRNGPEYGTTLLIAPANISVLTDVFAWFIVPLISIRRF